MQSNYDLAVALLYAIWHSIDNDFKSAYKMSIWQIFEDRVRVAAGQNGTLVKFASQLARTVNAPIGRNADDRSNAQGVIESGQDRELLRLYREETPYIVMLLRVDVAAKREEYTENE